jgi:hypothetical protein
VSVKNTLGQNYQMFITMKGKKNPTGIKLQYFCQYGDKKKTKTKTTKEQS